MKAVHSSTHEGRGIVVIAHDSPLDFGSASYLLESALSALEVATLINAHPNDLRQLKDIFGFAYMMQQIDYAIEEAHNPTDPYDEEETCEECNNPIYEDGKCEEHYFVRAPQVGREDSDGV
jgi:hypothetical protein